MHICVYDFEFVPFTWQDDIANKVMEYMGNQKDIIDSWPIATLYNLTISDLT